MRQYNELYIKLQKEFKPAHNMVIETMPEKFSNKDYVDNLLICFLTKFLSWKRKEIIGMVNVLLKRIYTRLKSKNIL